jgi:hypothetical protein
MKKTILIMLLSASCGSTVDTSTTKDAGMPFDDISLGSPFTCGILNRQYCNGFCMPKDNATYTYKCCVEPRAFLIIPTDGGTSLLAADEANTKCTIK